MSLVFEYDMPELKTDDGKVVPDSTAKFVLLALADHCNDEGEGAYPGVKRICKKTSMSSQTVCNALNALRHNKYTILEGKSKADTNNYTINLAKFQPLGFQPLESGDSIGKNSTIPAARVKPSINHQIKPDALDGILHYQLKPKAIQDSIKENFKLTPNWEAKYNRQFLEWALQENITCEQIQLAAKVWGSDKKFNWAHPSLKGIQEQWLQLIGSFEVLPAINEQAIEATKELIASKELTYTPMPDSVRAQLRGLSKAKGLIK